MANIYVDLLLDNGELFRIESTQKFEDDLHDSIENNMKRRDWWRPFKFDGCSAEYMGIQLDRVNMGRVIGTL